MFRVAPPSPPQVKEHSLLHKAALSPLSLPACPGLCNLDRLLSVCLLRAGRNRLPLPQGQCSQVLTDSAPDSSALWTQASFRLSPCLVLSSFICSFFFREESLPALSPALSTCRCQPASLLLRGPSHGSHPFSTASPASAWDQHRPAFLSSVSFLSGTHSIFCLQVTLRALRCPSVPLIRVVLVCPAVRLMDQTPLITKATAPSELSLISS